MIMPNSHCLGLLVMGTMFATMLAAVECGLATSWSYDMYSRMTINCSSNCTCLLSNQSRLHIDCDGKPSAGFDSELRQLWESFPTPVSLITELTISRSPLGSLQDSGACALASLRKLNLTVNPNLATLGRLGCFSRLETIWAETNSRLTAIDNDTFDGLTDLKIINLRDNSITSIHPEAFLQVPATHIDLGANDLYSLDIWPLFLLMGKREYISFQSNLISKFTNIQNLSTTELMPSGTLDLTYNQIQYMSDIARGWGFVQEQDIIDLFKKGTFYLDLDQNPLTCDCVDYEIITKLKKFRRIPMIKVLQCYDPEKLRGKHIVKVNHASLVCQQRCGSGCMCTEQPSTGSYLVDCKDRNLCQVPVSVPAEITRFETIDYTYHLSFQNSTLHALEARDYFRSASVADFRNNHIHSLNYSTLASLQDTPVVLLDHNELSNLDTKIAGLDLRNMTLTLENNSWHCNCEDLWFKHWLLSNNAPKGISSQKIKCAKPPALFNREIIHVRNAEFCPGTLDTGIVVSIVVLVPITTVLLVTLALFANFRFRVWLYAKTKWHPFDLDECIGEMKEYDAFVSYAEEDSEWVTDLIERLEAEGYRILFHVRDFLPGMSITESIGNAVNTSKRTICVLTPDFVKSAMCSWEFISVLNNDLLDNKRRLVLLVKELVPEEDRSLSLRGYMRNFTYIEAWADCFWDRLRYSLPLNKEGAQNSEGHQRADSMEDHALLLA